MSKHAPGQPTEAQARGRATTGRSRPDLPQLKVMLGRLDPLPLPVVTPVLAGQLADDPLYARAIRELRRSLGRGGLLYVGDCKMAALATRTLLHAGQDFYLLPLPEQQLPSA